ncbi:MAG: VWA domain-containing protein [Anaerolineales bacterium]|nr:VWA domain-containing protein [Anaerolineales bacterium]
MSKKLIITKLAIFSLALSVTACSGGSAKPIELLPVTVVPPATYPIQPAPLHPTSIPFPTTTPSHTVDQQQIIPEVRAGEVNDNERWNEYLTFRKTYRGPFVHDVDVSERYIIKALDVAGNPILDALVTVWQGQEKVWQARTVSSGTTMFFPRAIGASQSDEFIVSVNKDGIAQTFTMPRGGQEAWVVNLQGNQPRSNRVNLDVLFLLDSTGSMGDEIAVLQSSVQSIADQIDSFHPRPDLRFGLVTYRDRGDQYVVKKADFTSNVWTFENRLNNVQAKGGGDYPESLNEALYVAIHEMDWRDENCIRLVFLIADAPPHLDYAQDFDYAQEMAIAAANAIKVFPIAASGADDQAEYIFRQIAQFTQARFIFLTYEGPTNGGEPGDVSTMNVNSYGVQDLDDLVVRLVREELEPQAFLQ